MSSHAFRRLYNRLLEIIPLRLSNIIDGKKELHHRHLVSVSHSEIYFVRSLSRWPHFNSVYFCFSDTRSSDCCNTIWCYVAAASNHSYGCITVRCAQLNKTFWAHLKSFSHTELLCLQRYYSPRFELILNSFLWLLCLSAPPHEMKRYHEGCWHAHFYGKCAFAWLQSKTNCENRVLLSWLSINFGLQSGGKKLWTSNLHHDILIGGQRGSKRLANMLSSELVECKALTFQELRRSQWRRFILKPCLFYSPWYIWTLQLPLSHPALKNVS